MATRPSGIVENSRRDLLRSLAASTAAAWWLPSARLFGQPTSTRGTRPRVAAVFTVLRFRSHAYNILENFLGPYYFNGKLTDPGVDVVSFYADQFPHDDVARAVSRRFGIPLYDSIDKAMCVGGKDLAVDAVLSIGEHGNYPYNDQHQHLYPRKRFFDNAVAVMKRADRYVPFFNDKHFSWSRDESQEMFQFARSHRMPLIAGSSVPLAQRKPPLDLPAGTEIEEAVSIHGGGLESYDFHALEVLQSLVEARRGGETGIESIELISGDAFQQARKQRRWSQDLVDAAMHAEASLGERRQPRPTTGVFSKRKTAATNETRPGVRQPPVAGDYAIAIKYLDGLKATVLRLGSSADRWNFACRLRGDTSPHATAFFNSPWGNRGLFKALSHAIQHTFVTGREPWPADRTYLTTGAVEAVMRSYERGGAVVATPHLKVSYKPGDWSAFRERGATWQILTADVAQPAGFEPRSFDELGQ